MGQHTPGPWNMAPIPPAYQPGEETCVYVVDGAGRTIADCWPDDDAVPPHTERRANARLIAAAPALVEALERCLPWIAKAGESGAFVGCIRPEGWQKAIEQARAALALAKGGGKAS